MSTALTHYRERLQDCDRVIAEALQRVDARPEREPATRIKTIIEYRRGGKTERRVYKINPIRRPVMS